ncbi:hypothetical protein L9F63_006220 [Diploptera punctata]|uniref:Protein kinase domain-containing protein n=1 Tax=Diploptera punctata TaxID=6984 RepID=A0AAD7ZBH1_DIPPU|nr:hypothetical protein L9F63_006220 [Diploptera punctata]
MRSEQNRKPENFAAPSKLILANFIINENVAYEKVQVSQKNENNIDPFDQVMIQKLLSDIGFPFNQPGDNFQELYIDIPRFRTGAILSLGPDEYNIDKLIGEGSYAKVYKGVDTKTKRDIALKVQKPSWLWEYYICHQIQIRVSDPVKALAFMDVQKAYSLMNGSIIVSDVSQYGSLLSFINAVKVIGESFPNTLLLHWMVELLNIIQALQKCQIIHGDIKPDNFVVRSLSFSHMEPTLQLIDMGRGIDMTLFPEGTTFKHVVNTKCFQCIEMQTGLPWTYQTDFYGIAGTMHCLYFGEYMKVKQKNNKWFINNVIPRYRAARQIWEQFFYTLLNVESCHHLPDLTELRNMAKEKLMEDKTNKASVFLENMFYQKKKQESKAKCK